MLNPNGDHVDSCRKHSFAHQKKSRNRTKKKLSRRRMVEPILLIASSRKIAPTYIIICPIATHSTYLDYARPQLGP